MNFVFRFVSLFVILLLLVQCRRIEPVEPISKVETIPDLIQKESAIHIPIIINLQPYLKDIEKSLPKTFTGKEENCSGVSYSYKFNRDPILFEGMKNFIYYEIDGDYSLKLNYCPECTSLFDSKGSCIVPRIYVSCGIDEPMRRVTIGYDTQVKLTPDFRFKTTTTLRKFETKDPCEISVFRYDATNRLRKELMVVLKDLEKDIDKEIGGIDLRSEMEKVWSSLCEISSIGDYGYFCISPKAISLSDIKFYKTNAYLDLNLLVKPIVSTNPIEEVQSKLPDLSSHKPSKGFDVNLDIHATYDSLNSILSKNIKGKKVVIKNNEVIFQDVAIQGASHDQLTLKVDFDGKRKGTLFLVGTPVFDSIQQIITFPDLTFNLDTKNALLKSAKWLFNSKITDVLRSYARFDLKPHLEEIKKIVQNEMNREISEGVFISGHVESIFLKGIYPNHNNLIIRVNSTGDLTLSM